MLFALKTYNLRDWTGRRFQGPVKPPALLSQLKFHGCLQRRDFPFSSLINISIRATSFAPIANDFLSVTANSADGSPDVTSLPLLRHPYFLP